MAIILLLSAFFTSPALFSAGMAWQKIAQTACSVCSERCFATCIWPNPPLPEPLSLVHTFKASFLLVKEDSDTSNFSFNHFSIDWGVDGPLPCIFQFEISVLRLPYGVTVRRPFLHWGRYGLLFLTTSFHYSWCSQNHVQALIFTALVVFHWRLV